MQAEASAVKQCREGARWDEKLGMCVPYDFYPLEGEEDPDSPWPEHYVQYEEPEVGDEVWFEYHCFESEESCDAELWHHTHQKVTITKIYTPDETDIPMFVVKFQDGFEYDVNLDELFKSQKGFYRPDYRRGM